MVLELDLNCILLEDKLKSILGAATVASDCDENADVTLEVHRAMKKFNCDKAKSTTSTSETETKTQKRILNQLIY